jgi:pyruvate formate lyase activating enzyme
MSGLRGSTLTNPEGAVRTDIEGCVFNIERFAIRDGPGIRTTVFLKGCPLTCLWCSNPESIAPSPQLFYIEERCTGCSRCVEACPNGANAVTSEGKAVVDRDVCQGCGKCVEVCPNKARDIAGKVMTVEEVLDEVKKDSLFYQNSGGGITASGGEPTQQPEFLWHLFAGSHRAAIQTCLDTTGLVNPDTLRWILEQTDLVLYDIKHVDPARHKEFTGVDNALILENARLVAAARPMIIRVPLVPGHNDSEENLTALTAFMAELGLNRIDLLPYHSLAKTKYLRLGLEYELEGLQPFEPEQVKEIKTFLESKGLEVGVG